MSLYECLFNSMGFFIFTLPTLIIISTILLLWLTKKKLTAISLVFIVQVLFYYGYSCIILDIKITDVYLDYVKYAAIYTLIFGFIGIFIAYSVSSLIKLIKSFYYS